MTRTGSAGDPGSAITLVLNAEREARGAIDDCAAQAEARLADARSRARAIVRTTQQRISRLHKVCKAATERRVNALESPARAQGAGVMSASAERALLKRAAGEAARKLTTGVGSGHAD